MDAEELRRLAEAASGREWRAAGGRVLWSAGPGLGISLTDTEGMLSKADAAFVAAANPVQVLALLDERAATAAAIEEVRALCARTLERIHEAEASDDPQRGQVVSTLEGRYMGLNLALKVLTGETHGQRIDLVDVKPVDRSFIHEGEWFDATAGTPIDQVGLDIDPPVQHRPELDLDEARDLGVILEVNRRVLHPVGLALGMVTEMTDADDEETRLVIFDGRDDLTGVRFGNWSPERAAKVEAFAALEAEHHPHRYQALGYAIEPPPRNGLGVMGRAVEAAGVVPGVDPSMPIDVFIAEQALWPAVLHLAKRSSQFAPRGIQVETCGPVDRIVVEAVVDQPYVYLGVGGKPQEGLATEQLVGIPRFDAVIQRVWPADRPVPLASRVIEVLAYTLVERIRSHADALRRVPATSGRPVKVALWEPRGLSGDVADLGLSQQFHTEVLTKLQSDDVPVAYHVAMRYQVGAIALGDRP